MTFTIAQFLELLCGTLDTPKRFLHCYVIDDLSEIEIHNSDGFISDRDDKEIIVTQNDYLINTIGIAVNGNTVAIEAYGQISDLGLRFILDEPLEHDTIYTIPAVKPFEGSVLKKREETQVIELH